MKGRNGILGLLAILFAIVYIPIGVIFALAKKY